MASPIHRIKLVISFDQGIQCTLWPDPDAQIMSYIVLGSCVVALSRKESKFIAPFNTERSTQFRTHSKPDQRIQKIADSQPHLSQQSYPTILSRWQASLCPFSEFKQLPCPKIDHNSDSTCRRHLQWTHPEIQTELTGKELSLLKQTCQVWKRNPITEVHRYQYKDSRITKNSGKYDTTIGC